EGHRVLLAGPPRSAEEGITPVGGRDEGLLDGARARPAEQVQRAARLVVGARRAAPAEGLLADDGARGLVVDVEVAGGEAQRLGGPLDGVPIVGEDGPGEAVGAR